MSDSHDKQSGHDAHDHQHHVVPFWLLAAVFGALFMLTVITWAVAKVPLGEFNLIVALLIAVIKVSIVALFFMHLWWDSLFNAMALISAFAFVSLFIGLSILDTGEYKPLIDTWKQANPNSEITPPADKKTLGGSAPAAEAKPAAESKPATESKPAAEPAKAKDEHATRLILTDRFASAFAPDAVLVPIV
ncbi:MAG: hypothetical protein GC159_15665 [Phycisphaera sp.]|nr:hypothetical protein [Phycisphaera sp.]